MGEIRPDTYDIVAPLRPAADPQEVPPNVAKDECNCPQCLGDGDAA